MDFLGKAGRPKIAKESFRKIPRAPAPITTPTRRWPASQSHRLQRQVATLQYTIDPSEACTQCYHDASMAVTVVDNAAYWVVTQKFVGQST
jgi:hypothetical protein